MEDQFQDFSLPRLWRVLPLKHTLVNSKVLKRNNLHPPRAIIPVGQHHLMVKGLIKLEEMERTETTQLLIETGLKAQTSGSKSGLITVLNMGLDIYYQTKQQESSSMILLRLY